MTEKIAINWRSDLGLRIRLDAEKAGTSISDWGNFIAAEFYRDRGEDVAPYSLCPRHRASEPPEPSEPLAPSTPRTYWPLSERLPK